MQMMNAWVAACAMDQAGAHMSGQTKSTMQRFQSHIRDTWMAPIDITCVVELHSY
jgi:hypothetical protein